MSLYSLKKAGGGATQPWSQVITLAEAGKGCDGLFGLYDSLGDKTLTGANTIATLLDGPEKVARYGALTLGDGVTATSLTASNRCKGLTILCDSLTVKANATLHMTAKGPRVDRADDPFFPFVDFIIPFKISLDSSRMSLSQALAVIKSQGLAPWDIGTFQHVIAAMFGFNLGISLAGSLMLLNWASPGGAGAASQTVYQYQMAGNPGSAGANGGCGGGGHSAIGARIENQSCPAYHFYPAGRSNPYGGGCGTSGFSAGAGYGSLRDAYDYVRYSYLLGDPQGPGGGGAGIPAAPAGIAPWGGPVPTAGGEGVGGRLVIICRGTITVQSGGKIEANGMPGGAAGATYGCGGGGSGGGSVYIISPNTVSNAGTIQAAGGAGGAGQSANGGAGGAGSVVTKAFSDMGW